MRIENLRVTVRAGVARVAADVIWEDCNRPPLTLFVDVEERFQAALRPDPNALLMNCLVPAWHAGERRIAIDGSLCPLQQRNIGVVFAKLSRWFPADFQAPPRIEPSLGYVTAEPQGTSLSMLSCGIDSLATLRWNSLNVPRNHPRAIRAVAHVCYDHQEGQSLQLLREAAAARLPAIQNVAADADVEVISIRTNGWSLVNDGYVFSLKWHGAAFAAMGALLSARFQRVYVAAGQDPWVDEPWGSHPMLDPYYSTAYFSVEHDGILSRLEKTRLVADWQVGLDNLRVCQNHTEGEANCGTCEKCIRTTLMLLTLGRLRSRALPSEVDTDLIQLLDDYQMISPLEGFIDYYDNMVPGLAAQGRTDLSDALARVLRATRARHQQPGATSAPAAETPRVQPASETGAAPAIDRGAQTNGVAVVGGGPVGALLALMLANRGLHVNVYEMRPDPRVRALTGGRSINLTLAERGWQALRAAGVESEVRNATIPLHGRLIHSEGDSRFQPYTLSGDAIFSASRSWLATLLTELADRHANISFHFNHRCRDVDVAKKTLTLDGAAGSVVEIRPEVVFAADGAFSSVRRSLVRRGLVTFSHRLSPLMYKELRVAADTEVASTLQGNVLHLWPRGDRMTVAFPNQDGSFTFSLFMPAQGEMSFGALTGRDALQAYFESTCPLLAPVTDALLHDFFAGPPSPLTSGNVTPWVFGDWLALIGDAAHTVVPFLGQGLNAGFEDCSVVDGLLAQQGADWAQVLPEYERLRIDNCDAIIRLAEQHFDELAKAAREPLFLVRKALENKAHHLRPDVFIPVYTRVAFRSDPYSQVEKSKVRQEAVLDRIMTMTAIADRWDGPEVEKVLISELAALDQAATTP